MNTETIDILQKAIQLSHENPTYEIIVYSNTNNYSFSQAGKIKEIGIYDFVKESNNNYYVFFTKNDIIKHFNIDIYNCSFSNEELYKFIKDIYGLEIKKAIVLITEWKTN